METAACKHCGKEFSYYPSSKSGNFCSRACQLGYSKSHGIPLGRRPSSPPVVRGCRNCGREFSFSKSELQRRDPQYCSVGCYQTYTKEHGLRVGVKPSRKLTAKCRNCGKDFSYYPSAAKHGNPAYCSPACWYDYSRAHGLNGKRKDKILKHCEVCGKEIWTHPSDATRKRYCSKTCLGKVNGQRQAKALYNSQECTCLWCGTSFTKPASAIAAGRGLFCSRECLGAYTVRYKQDRVSRPERAFGELLERSGLRIETQVRVGRFVVDYMLLDAPVAIEFDGTFWHSLESVKERDRRKDQTVRESGLEMVRVPESLYNEDPFEAVQLVVDAVARIAGEDETRGT